MGGAWEEWWGLVRAEVMWWSCQRMVEDVGGSREMPEKRIKLKSKLGSRDLAELHPLP